MNIHTAIATLFGLGRVRTAPGTVASLVALPLAWIIANSGGRISLLLATIFVAALGGWACEHYVRETGKEDPSECVVDELAGQWLACAFAPLSLLHGLLAYALAFILFRALDIFKPWPMSAAERLPGGLGVMADDLLAGLLAGLVVAVFAHAGLV
jgi:phosphatidylglycerophosphatase A